jgi:hypothetical protein
MQLAVLPSAPLLLPVVWRVDVAGSSAAAASAADGALAHVELPPPSALRLSVDVASTDTVADVLRCAIDSASELEARSLRPSVSLGALIARKGL